MGLGRKYFAITMKEIICLICFKFKTKKEMKSEDICLACDKKLLKEKRAAQYQGVKHYGR